MSCTVQDDLPVLLNFVSMVVYESHGEDSSSLTSQILEAVNTTSMQDMATELGRPLIRASMPALQGWLYLVMEDTLHNTPNGHNALEACLAIFNHPDSKQDLRQLFDLLTKGLRSLRGADLCKNTVLVQNVGSVCLLLVNRAKVPTTALPAPL